MAIDYRDEDFVEVVKEHTDGAGADVILDNMGASYLGRNVAALATEGRLVVIGMQGGTKGELDLNALLRKRGADHRHHAARPGRPRRRPRSARRSSSTSGRWSPTARSGRSCTRPSRSTTSPRARADGVRRAHREDPAAPSLTGRWLPWRHERAAADGATATRTSEDGQQGERQVVIVGPDGQPMGAVPESALAMAAAGGGGEESDERAITDLVEQPAKVMRIGSMIRQLLEEVKAAPLDEASRNRLKEIHQASIHELEAGLAPELVEELERLTLPFSEDQTPSEGELRIAQAQLVGWLEGLFHGIQTAIYAQQMAARRSSSRCAAGCPMGPSGQPPAAGATPSQPHQPGDSGGMYL